jgi:hypothetical protein
LIRIFNCKHQMKIEYKEEENQYQT